MKFERIIHAVLLLLLWMPLFQYLTQVFSVSNLNGYIRKDSYKGMSVSGWFNEDYQKNTENYLKDHIGFRPLFIRIHNQIEYSLFNQLHAAGVIAGKKNYLYEENYLKAYYGLDFLGKDSISENISILAAIKDSLQKNQTKLLIVFAPGKASFYPEYHPPAYDLITPTISNLQYYKSQLVKFNMHTIDFNEWFKSMKDTSSYVLYPKYGIHWSDYGMVLAMDSLTRYIEDIKNLDIPNPEIVSLQISNQYKNTDYDIGASLNLFIQLSPSGQLAYPKFIWKKNIASRKPKVIVIADSFYWGMFNKGIATEAFSMGGFWYYFNEIHPGGGKVEELEQVKEILEEQDVIVLMATEATLQKFPFGFIERMKKEYSINFNK